MTDNREITNDRPTGMREKQREKGGSWDMKDTSVYRNKTLHTNKSLPFELFSFWKKNKIKAQKSLVNILPLFSSCCVPLRS